MQVRPAGAGGLRSRRTMRSSRGCTRAKRSGGSFCRPW